MKQNYLLFLLFFSCCLSANLSAQNGASKIDERLLSYEGTAEKFEFLVQFDTKTDLRMAAMLKDKTQKGTTVMRQLQQQAATAQAGVLAVLEAANVPFQDFWIANVIWVHGDFALAAQLAARPEVLRVSENSKLKIIEPIPAAPLKNGETEWGISNMNVPAVWDLGFRGQGVVVGGQDTGYEWEHESLKASYRGWDGTVATHDYNWHDAVHAFDDKHAVAENPCGLDASAPCDDNNHGTHTMGTMVGATDRLNIGVAPAARWIGCRNMERGWGTPQTYLECFQWFLAPTDLNNQNPDPSKAPHVINNSWGCPPVEGCNENNFDILKMAVDNLKAAGVVVVASAGNDGAECSTISNPPAMFESSFSVGATSDDDVIAGFSSRGNVTVDGSGRLKPNVAAPGVAVRSAVRNNEYATYSGTSMAGPHVAGLVALLISADPTLAGDVERIETLIEQSARPQTSEQTCGDVSGASVPNAVYGFGIVNALAAVELLQSKPAVQPEWSLFPNPTTDIVTIKYTGYNAIATFELFAADGRKVLSEEINFEGGNKLRQLSLAFLPKGIYFYRLCPENGDCLMQGSILVQ